MLQQLDQGDSDEVDISRFLYVTMVGEGNVNKEDQILSQNITSYTNTTIDMNLEF